MVASKQHALKICGEQSHEQEMQANRQAQLAAVNATCTVHPLRFEQDTVQTACPCP